MSAVQGSLNLLLRQNMGAAQADIERLMFITFHIFDSFSFSSYSN
jgi:hypothetical protein